MTMYLGVFTLFDLAPVVKSFGHPWTTANWTQRSLRERCKGFNSLSRCLEQHREMHRHGCSLSESLAPPLICKERSRTLALL